MKEQNQAYLVIGIAFCGAAAGALSLVLQKNAHKNTEQSGQSTYKNTLWIWGMLLLLLSQVIYIGVLPFGDLILFSTTGAMTLVCNAVFSAYLLGELFTRIDLLATTLILTGTVAIVLQTHKEPKDFNKEFILELMLQPTQSITLITFYVYITCVYLLDRYVEKRIDKFYREAFMSSPINSDEGFTSYYARDKDAQIKKYQPSYSYLINFIQSHPQEVLSGVSPSFRKLQLFVKLPMLFMALGCGMIAATNGVYFKLAGELIKSNSDEYNSFTDWLMYVFIVLGVMGAFIQLAFLQKMMSKYNQMESMPIFYGSMILFEIFAGLYLLDECIHYNKTEIFGLYLGAIITILGIQVIMKKTAQISATNNNQNNITPRNQSHDHSFYEKNEQLNKTDDFLRYNETDLNSQILPPQSTPNQSTRVLNNKQICDNLIGISDSETGSQADSEQGICQQTRQVYERLHDMRREQKENMMLHN